MNLVRQVRLELANQLIEIQPAFPFRVHHRFFVQTNVVLAERFELTLTSF
jgi:hypothetical protein